MAVLIGYLLSLRLWIVFSLEISFQSFHGLQNWNDRSKIEGMNVRYILIDRKEERRAWKYTSMYEW